MKAVDRCTEHYQGDRCIFSKGHENINDARVHLGNFTSWSGDYVLPVYAKEYHRDRKVAREDRQRKTWIKNTTLMIRLGALAQIYLKPFMKEPEDKNVVSERNLDLPSQPQHESGNVGSGNTE